MLTSTLSDLAVVVVCLRLLELLLDAQDTHLILSSVEEGLEGFIRYIQQKLVADDVYNNSTKTSFDGPLAPSVMDATTGTDIDEHLRLLFGYNLPVHLPQNGANSEGFAFQNEAPRTSWGLSGMGSGGTLFNPSNPLHVAGKMAFFQFEEDNPSVSTCHSRML